MEYLRKTSSIDKLLLIVESTDTTPVEHEEVAKEEEQTLLLLSQNMPGATPFIAASETAIGDHLKQTKGISDLLIEYMHNPLGWPGLHYAIEQKRPDLAKAFIQFYPEQVSATTPPFKICVWLDWGSSRHEYDPGFSALELAIKNDLREIVELLLQKGADPNLTRRDILTHYYQDWDRQMVRQIDYNEAFPYCVYTPLYWAIIHQQESTVQLLLDHGAKIDHTYYVRIGYAYQLHDIPDKSKTYSVGTLDASALHLALETKNQAIIEIILKQLSTKTASPNDIELFTKYELNEKKWPAVHFAISCGDLEAVETLLKFGFPFKEQGTSPETAFQLALKQQNPKFAQLLIDHGFSKSQAFDQAASAKNVYWMKELAQAANKTSTALKIAIGMHDLDLVKLLLKEGFSDPAAVKEATLVDDIELVRLFLELGLRDLESVKIALEHNQLQIATLLLEHEKISSPPQSQHKATFLRDLSLASIQKANLEFFKLFYAYKTTSLPDALMAAIQEEKVEIFHYLACNEKLNLQEPASKNCFVRAAELNQLDSVKTLVEQMGITDEIKASCIKQAIQFKRNDILNYLFSL